ncbi:MAG TPA: ABC transporter permease [Thermoleophilaceae bacterium]
MSTWAYTRLELLRTSRNVRFMFFSLGFPLLLYFLIAGPNRHEQSFGDTHIPIPLYFMVTLASFGTMTGMVTTGARIAFERTVGWTRQLRVTPLSAAGYFRAKLITAYSTAVITIVLVYSAGLVLGVSMPAGRWFAMTGLILVGLAPFAALGITLGHLLDSDAVGPAAGGTVSLLAFVSGTWFPIDSDSVLHLFAQWLPSYWLVQASHISLGGAAWGVRGWAVVIGWTAILTATAVAAFRRDTQRV